MTFTFIPSEQSNRDALNKALKSISENKAVQPKINCVKEFRLVPMVQFICDIDAMTTKEFCEAYGVPLPTLDSGANDLFRLDAIKQRMFVSYAKLLSKAINGKILGSLGFEIVQKNEGRGFQKFKKGRHTITNDQHGFWFEDSERISKIEDLTKYEIVCKNIAIIY